MPSTFSWHGRELRYFDHDYNNTRNNERAVEVAIARDWLGDDLRLKGTHPAGLEVGNVLGHYGCTWPRRVVDLAEQAEGVENIDVADITGRYPWIVSVSTIEHVGMAEYGAAPVPMAATEAIFLLQSLLTDDGRMLVTIPFGHNADLDTDIAMGALDVTRQCTLHRIQTGNRPPVWLQASDPVAPLPYDSLARSAAAVWIGEW